MLSHGEDTAWIGEFYDHISDGGVKEAFALLIGTFSCLKGVTCGRKAQGEVRSVGIKIAGECLFALMPAKDWLTFQWRPPVTRTKRYSESHLHSQFPESFTSTAQVEHWSVKITSIEDARLLLLILELS